MMTVIMFVSKALDDLLDHLKDMADVRIDREEKTEKHKLRETNQWKKIAEKIELQKRKP